MSGPLRPVGYGQPITAAAGKLESRRQGHRRSGPRRRTPALLWLLTAAGVVGIAVAATLRPASADAAAAQVWPPFVLVSGLLLVGLVNERDGLFEAAGAALARHAGSRLGLFASAVALTSIVTAVLNLDTAAALLTPILVHASADRFDRHGPEPVLYTSLLVANAASLFLPGANLTNLIVIDHLHLTGSEFFVHAAPAAVAAVLVTAATIAIRHRQALLGAPAPTGVESGPRTRVHVGVGLAALLVATGLVLTLSHPALPVLGVGVGAAIIRLRPWRTELRTTAATLGLPALIGLFGLAVAFGTIGRAWSGPELLLSHLGAWTSACFAALTAAGLNNLPAASLLAAKTPPHPFALLIGLNLGPNLLFTGSLSWLIWWQAATGAGARPSLSAAMQVSARSVPPALAAGVALLLLTAAH